MTEPTEMEAIGASEEDNAAVLDADAGSLKHWRKPMVIGKIGADLRPMVPIVVQGADGAERKIPVLLSTGFREALLLPPAEVAALGLPAAGERDVEFPDGSRIVATVHPAQVLLMGEAHPVDILAGGWEARMGLALFQNCRLSMRFVPGEEVRAERLERNTP